MSSDYMIYPKQFRFATVAIEKKSCFFLMPFEEKFDEVYGVIKSALTDAGYICNRADDLSESKPIMSKILNEILKSQYVIADLTDSNPNVFYELGVTHTFKESRNVLLIKQKGDSVPFDITHLQYIEYTTENLKFLTSNIKKFIAKNQHFIAFHEALNIHGVIQTIHDNNKEFLHRLQEYLINDIDAITDILTCHAENLNREDVKTILDRYQLFIHEILKDDKPDLLPEILHLYVKLLLSCKYLDIVETHTSTFLDNFFEQHNLPQGEILGVQIDLAIALAKEKRVLSTVMPWIIKYFSRSKAGHIDVNRAKLENFLLTSNIKEIDEMIINALSSPDCHVRENFADIIGEKCLYQAKDTLFKKLQSEKNYYTARSMINAIASMDDPNGISHILQWLKKNESEIIQRKSFFILQHAKIALKNLDTSPDKIFERQFSQEFGMHISENTPL